MIFWLPIVPPADPLTIYHITSAREAERAAGTGDHCSYAHQVIAVAHARYRSRAGLVLLEIDRSRMHGRVVDENLEGGDELFPHIYGRVPMSAVLAVHEFQCEGRLLRAAGRGAWSVDAVIGRD